MLILGFFHAWIEIFVTIQWGFETYLLKYHFLNGKNKSRIQRNLTTSLISTDEVYETT